MKERPILFSAPMVRAILEGRKTQTRRAGKPVRHPDLGNMYDIGAFVLEHEPQHIIERACPYGQPGDQLWVRETWNWFDPTEIPSGRHGKRAPFTGCQGPRLIEWIAAYAADGQLYHPSNGAAALWRPSIHMPRWASRIQLEITAVRIERLQDISEEDAQAEGITRNGYLPECGLYPNYADKTGKTKYVQAVDSYMSLWESLNGAGSWKANPWAWVVEFKVLKSGAA